MKIYTYLPEQITTKAGHIYTRVNLPYGDALQQIIDRKDKGEKHIKYVKIGVLEKNLRGKTDLRGNYYRPTTWVFILDYVIPKGTIISQQSAEKLASDWHGGQWSALYQFASSGVYMGENHLRYLEEIEQNLIAPETALKPFDRSKKLQDELISLKKFFIHKGLEINLRTVYEKDKYGFDLPYLHESVPDDYANHVKQITRMQ